MGNSGEGSHMLGFTPAMAIPGDESQNLLPSKSTEEAYLEAHKRLTSDGC